VTVPRITNRRGLVWAAGLIVAAGAGIATAHGLYEVAIATGVPRGIAWLYPLITDGLALVAYAATGRLDRRGRGYAWTVGVLAAGLSGLAQAAYLAGGVTTAPTALRFGVGAWPAIAATVVAHLVHLLSTARPQSAQEPAHGESDTVDQSAVFRLDTSADRLGFKDSRSAEAPAAEPPTVQPAQDAPIQRDEPPAVQPVQAAEHLVRPVEQAGVVPAGERARAAAREHRDRHGRLPSVSELASLAGVARGTASAVLRQLRTERPALQIVPRTSEKDTDQ
jgi:Protein of unknown function (DUF2637)